MPSLVEGFRGPQVCSLVGVSYRQLDYWARTDLIKPSIGVANGSGTVRRYSEEDIVLLAVVRDLLDAGLSLGKCREALTVLREHPETQFALVTAGGVVLATGDTLVDAVLTSTWTTILAFEVARRRVRAAINETAMARAGDDRD